MSAFSINGEQVYNGGTYSNFTAEGEQQIASGSMWINHNTDGTKTFSISSFTGWLYSNHNYSSNGGSFELTPIPRQATLTSAPNFTDLDNPTIYYSNPAGNSVTLQTCVAIGWNPIIPYKEDISETATSYTFKFSDEERKILRNAIGGKNDIKVNFFVTTYIGSTPYYSYKEVTLTMAESDVTKPTVTMGVTLNNGLLPSEFKDKFADTYIQGKSKVDVELSATGKYSATISSYSATVDEKSYNSDTFTSGVIQKSGIVEIIGYAKDTRGFTGTVEQQISVVEYSKPLVIPIGSANPILCYRSDGNGQRTGNSTSVWIKAKRSFHSVNGKNRCALQWRRKLSTEAWAGNEVGWSNLLAKEASANEYNAMIPNTVFDKTKSYTVQIRAIDDIGEYDIKTFDIPTEDVALHLGKGGKNVSVGSYCDYSEEHTFHSEWKAVFDKEVIVGGEQLNDFVVEQGTDGIWTYRKWNSGIAECWGATTEKTISITSPYGAAYYYQDVVSELFPKDENGNDLFADKPTGVSVQNYATMGLIGCYIHSLTQYGIGFFVSSLTAGTFNLQFTIKATGRWK
jgi:hypothetical protein